MTLEYTPELIDYRLQSFNDDGRHYVTGFLIGTKVGDKGWGVHRDTIKENVKKFIGKDWIVSPKQLDPSEHFLVGKTYEEQLEKQKLVTKGEITDVLGPYSYNDGSDDFYYKFKAEVKDKAVSDALITGRLPFATSPYIWPTNETGQPIQPEWLTAEERSHVKNWIPVHEALVTQGTFGDIAKIGKQCLGPQGVCTKALAGSSEQVAEILSSQIDIAKQLSGNTMSEQQKVEVPSQEPQKVESPQVISQAPIQTPKVEEVVKEENKDEKLAEVLRQLEIEKKNNAKLMNIHKSSVLSSIFTNFEDENTKKETIKKYLDQDVEVLQDFAADVLKYGIPKRVKKENELAGSSKEQKETFPLAGNSSRMNRLNQEQSLTGLLGGIVK